MDHAFWRGGCAVGFGDVGFSSVESACGGWNITVEYALATRVQSHSCGRPTCQLRLPHFKKHGTKNEPHSNSDQMRLTYKKRWCKSNVRLNKINANPGESAMEFISCPSLFGMKLPPGAPRIPKRRNLQRLSLQEHLRIMIMSRTRLLHQFNQWGCENEKKRGGMIENVKVLGFPLRNTYDRRNRGLFNCRSWFFNFQGGLCHFLWG